MGRVARTLLLTGVTLAGLAVPAQAQGWQPRTAANTTAQLAAVSCTSASSCWAVGNDSSGGVAERWNGSSWQVVPTSNPPKATDLVLDGVACAQVTSCWAVGYYDSFRTGFLPLVEAWNGKAWSDVTIPLPPKESFPRVVELSGVSCPAANLCFILGSWTRKVSDGTDDTSLIERWDGSSWQVMPRGVVVDGNETFLQGISCASTAACWAVGSWNWIRAGYPYKTGSLGDFWNGQRWVAQRIGPAVLFDRGSHGRALTAVSCATPGMCMATGLKIVHDVRSPLAQRWDGSAWAPAQFGTSDGINAVSCATRRMCMAVGEAGGLAAAERWNGSSWSSVPAGPAGGVLSAVTCLQASNCWATGGGGLIEHWNGTSWTVVSS